MSELLVATPLSLERLAVRAARRPVRVVRTGMGPRRSRQVVPRLAAIPSRTLAVMGYCGALESTLRPGELLVANEIRDPDGAVIACPGAEILAGELARAGLDVRVGPLASEPRLVTGAARGRLAEGGALAVDMESAWLAAAAAGRPLAVVRAVLDTPDREVHRPLATATGVIRASAALRRAVPVLERWSAAVRSRRVLLAGPRASCAGVDRAIAIVETALAAGGAPLYVRRQIVHNSHVVSALEAQGAVFVEELDEVPDGATVVFSAHGVAPAVRAEAERRGLRVIDATCPLVSKVHAEARRFAARGMKIVLVGHSDHEEVEGITGEAPGQISVVGSPEEVRPLDLPPDGRVAYLTQTTLAVDETATVVAALRERAPDLLGPNSDDICYATQNRQDAVRAIATACDRVLVVGSANSSNSIRLVEVAERAGAPARLIEDEGEIDLGWLAGAATVGVTAGASAREEFVQRVVAGLGGLGEISIEERSVAEENVHFKLAAGLHRDRGLEGNGGEL
ncbi:MAG: 4-hydroxy-3-methylbut-2-enyl diphosphate reductase [Solirubrobacteraceae bacterium]